jgi:hypothetical protein
MLLALASIQFGRLGSMFGKPKELFADELRKILAAKAHTRSGHLYQATFLLKAQDKCEMFSPLKDSSLYTLPTNAAPSLAGVDGFLRGPWRSWEFLNIALAP